MTSILFLTEAIYCNILNTIIWETKNFFWIFLAFSKFIFNFEHFERNMTLIGDVFLNLRTPKHVVR